jgi:hypothetical protein
MLKGMLAIVAVFFLSASVYGDIYGETRHAKEFEVRSDSSSISKWMKSHAKEVAKSTGSELVSTDGDKIRLRQDTPVGILEFTCKETNSDNGSVYYYKSVLVEVHKGLIVSQTTEIKLEPSKRGTLVTIKMSASVRETTPFEIKASLTKSVRGFQQLIERNFR